MSYSALTHGHISFIKDTPDEIKKNILKELSEVCESDFLRNDIYYLWRHIIISTRKLLSKYNFKYVNKNELKCKLKETIDKEIDDFYHTSVEEYVITDINWRSHVLDDKIKELINKFRIFIDYASIYILYMYSGLEESSIELNNICNTIECSIKEYISNISDDTEEEKIFIKMIEDITKMNVKEEFKNYILDIIKKENKNLFIKIISDV